MTKFLSKTDRIILNELCKHGDKYLKVDITSLARSTRLARNTVSSRVDVLLKKHLLKVIAAENFELQGFDSALLVITPALGITDEEFKMMKKYLVNMDEVEDLFELGNLEGRLIFGVVITWVSPFRRVGPKTYLREEISLAPLRIREMFQKRFVGKIEDIRSYFIIDTPKLLFNYCLSNYDVTKGAINP
ncbi:hypothetical protein HZB90_04700 [archaeon]|nr:hypothetical protein [archaeon]